MTKKMGNALLGTKGQALQGYTNGMNMITTLLFDLNGVLILDKPGYKASVLERDVFKRLGLSLNDAKKKDDIKKELNWNENDFWSFVEKSWQGAIPNFELVSFIQKLKKAGYKTAIVSNTSGLIIREKINNYFGEDINSLFDEIIISSEVGLLKPDEKIYRLALDGLGSKPQEAVFIDDAEEYLEGAKAVKIKSILYKSNDQVISDIKKIL